MKTPKAPHVVILPFPAQGHIKPMLNLAMLLSHSGMRITFTTSKAVLEALVNQIDIASFLATFPSFNFKFLSDGYPTKFTSNNLDSNIAEAFDIASKVTPLHFHNLLASICVEDKESSPPTCVIADGIMSFAIEMAAEFGIPAITFRTYSATCTWVYFHLQKLIDQHLIPVQQEELDTAVTCIPGLEDKVRLRDLPGFCRQRSNSERAMLQFYLNQTCAMRKAFALILNTFEELEPDSITGLRSIFPKVYPIGPLQSLSQKVIPTPDSGNFSGSTLIKKDKSCMEWLDLKQPNSVLYISFGSFFTLGREEILELWHGIVNSGKHFLWVTRSGYILDEYDNSATNIIPTELVTGTRERGLVVKWVPQEEVLAHSAIGGFLTHCGWNSTLESISAGVCMIGLPGLADQQVNSRCVEKLWNVGIDIKDTCDRTIVENAVRRLMECTDQDTKEMVARADEFRISARRSLEAGGSSLSNLKKLIEDVSNMNC